MAVGALKAIKKARETRQRAVRQQLQQFLVDGQQQALAAVVMAAQATEEEAGRRTVERAAGKWRGSTIGGYLRGDNRTYLENFRCSRHHFKDLSSRSCATVAWTNHVLRVGAARFQKAHGMRDAPVQSCSMHVCSRACGPLKVLALTLRAYLERGWREYPAQVYLAHVRSGSHITDQAHSVPKSLLLSRVSPPWAAEWFSPRVAARTYNDFAPTVLVCMHI